MSGSTLQTFDDRTIQRALWRGDDPVIARTEQVYLDELDRLDLKKYEASITASDIRPAPVAAVAGQST